jgi:ankyrin repeat protein
LRDKRTKSDVLKAMDSFHSGSAALDEAYNRAVERIDAQLHGDVHLAKRALAWITFAQRDLTADELRHALAIEPGIYSLDHDKLCDIDDILSVCAGLVVLDKQTKLVRLVHATAQTYFERSMPKWYPESQVDIATTCLTYLSLDSLAAQIRAENYSLERKLAENVLLGYAAVFWHKHVRTVQGAVEDAALHFLCNKIFVGQVVEIVKRSSPFAFGLYEGGTYDAISGLHLTAAYNLPKLTCLLANRQTVMSPGVEAMEDNGRTPLSWAASQGAEQIVRLLLERQDVDPDSRDKYNRTPLSYAAGSGCVEIVQLLLQHSGVQPNLKNINDRTPLSYAASNGSMATFKLLLEHPDVDPDSRTTKNMSPLYYAADYGRMSIVDLLLARNDVDIEVRETDNLRTPLMVAATENHVQILAKLLHGGANIDATDKSRRTALLLAVEQGHAGIVKALLSRDASVHTIDKDGWAPITVAAQFGRHAIVRTLHEYGADLCFPQQLTWYKPTPLSMAAAAGHLATVKALLECGAPVDIRDRDGTTPLFRAAENGRVDVLNLLLQHGANPELVRDDGRRPLDGAIRRGHTKVVEILKTTGCSEH